jgi:hypothetical protein
MFEEMAHFHFFLDRIEASHHRAVQLSEQEEPRFRNGKQPTEDWTKKFISARLEIAKRVAKAIQGSDYNWKGWYKDTLEKYDLPDGELEALIAAHTNARKTHINDCLASLEEKQQLNANDTYNLLSEMVHPNFGSNTLVIVTRSRISDLVGNVELSSNPKNVEAAAWFFELAATPLVRVFELERNYVKRSQELLKFYKNAASTSREPAGR